MRRLKGGIPRGGKVEGQELHAASKVATIFTAQKRARSTIRDEETQPCSAKPGWFDELPNEIRCRDAVGKCVKVGES